MTLGPQVIFFGLPVIGDFRTVTLIFDRGKSHLDLLGSPWISQLHRVMKWAYQVHPSASKCCNDTQQKSAKKITQQPCATHGLHDFARRQIPVTKRSQCFEQPPKETCFRIDLATWRLGDVKIGRRSESFSPIFGWCLTARFGLQFSLDLFFFHPVCGNLFQLVAGLCWAYTPKSGSFQLGK